MKVRITEEQLKHIIKESLTVKPIGTSSLYPDSGEYSYGYYARNYDYDYDPNGEIGGLYNDVNPDHLRIADREFKNWLVYMNYDEMYAFPYLYIDDKLVIGKNGKTHGSTYYNYCKSLNVEVSSLKQSRHGRIFHTDDFDYIVSWDHTADKGIARVYYKKVCKDFLKDYGRDIRKCVVVFNDGKNVKAAVLNDYIRGGQAYEFNDFLDRETGLKHPSIYDRFANDADPNDDEHKRIQRYREWYGYGNEVAEEKKKKKGKRIFMTEAQLKRLFEKEKYEKPEEKEVPFEKEPFNMDTKERPFDLWPDLDENASK